MGHSIEASRDAGQRDASPRGAVFAGLGVVLVIVALLDVLGRPVTVSAIIGPP